MIKKITLSVCTLFCVFSLHAQTILQPVSIPSSGDLWANKQITDTTIQPGAGGFMTSWNFLNYIVNPSVVSENFGTPNGAGNDAFFPTANLKVTSLFGGTDYYIKTSNSLQFLGSKSNTFEIIISNQQLIMSVPFQFGDSISNPSVSGSGLGYPLTGTISVVADATGNLSLYTGAFTNTLRVRTDMNLVLGAGSGIDTYIHIEKYTWYSTYYRAPVFQIAVFDMNGVLGTFHQKWTTVSTLTTDVNDLQSSKSAFSFYPNPVRSNSEIHLYSSENLNAISLLNISGKTVKTWKAIALQHLLLDDVLPGIYFLEAKSENGIEIKKLIVE
jgi:hypothetical protein